MVKVGIKRVKNQFGKKQTYNPFEDEFCLSGFLRVESESKSVGAAILRKHQSDDFKIVYAFECRAIQPLLKLEQIDSTFDALEQGLKDFPEQETLTVHLGSFTDDLLRQRQLDQLVQQNQNCLELQLFVKEEKKRVSSLTEKGIRKTKFLNLYCSYTAAPGESKDGDSGEKLLGKLENFWENFTGEYEETQSQKIQQILVDSFENGYQRWKQFLTNKLGLIIRPQTEVEIWENLWYRFNRTEPISVPQTIVINGNTIQEKINTERHPVSLLLSEDESVPVADRKWVKVKDKYVGALIFADKPGGWLNKKAQLRYLWQLLADEEISDTEIFCQLSLADPNILNDKLDSLTKQGNLALEESATNNNIDIAAANKVEQSIEARKSLYGGDVPLYTSVVFLVHRNNLKQLDSACKNLSSKFKRPAWVAREIEYAWRIWLETFPIVWDKMLTKYFNRRITYLNSEVPGITPLVCTRLIDQDGFEFIATEGGTPIHLDWYTKHRSIGIFAGTGSGKSVLFADMVVQALARGLPGCALDYPRADGSGTFSDITSFLGDKAAYLDTGKECCNLFEPPDLRELESKKQGERFSDFKDSLLEMIQTMVVGIYPRGDVNPDTVRSILVLAIEKFFSDHQIKKRYAAAIAAGFGTTAGQDMPVLPDFIKFCGLERLQLINPSYDTVKTLDFIKLRLRYWLNSKVGKCFGRVSTFDTDAPLLVIACRNLSNAEDAAMIALTANLAATTRSLKYPASFYALDEAAVLFEHEEVARSIAKSYAIGRKAGTRTLLLAQEPNTIAQSHHGSKVIANMDTRIIGKIEPGTVEYYIKHFKYQSWEIEPNSTEAYLPNSSSLYSKWLLDDGISLTPVRRYISPTLLAVLANNRAESEARAEAMLKTSNKFEAIVNLAKKLYLNTH